MVRSGIIRGLVPIAALAALSAPGGAAWAQVQTFGTVRGTVQDADGKPLSGTTITLQPPKGPAQTATTDDKGNFQILGVSPGAYTLTAAKEKLTHSQALTVTQDTISSITVRLESDVSHVTINVSPVSRGQSSTQTNITARTEQLDKTQPNNLYQFTGLVFGQPGIDYDPLGYVHIKGGDENQVGYQVDGVDVTEFLDHQFATNIVTVGLKSANLLTDGADASYGDSGSGFINETTYNGRDLKGGLFEYTAGPSNGWNYNEARLDYGNVSGNGRLDYYGSTINFTSNFPGNTQISNVLPSSDGLLKFNYYANGGNTFTGLISNGRERYGNYTTPEENSSPEYAFYNPATGVASTRTNYAIQTSEQTYDFNYFNYLHKFNNLSFLNFKASYIYSRDENDFFTDSGEYDQERSRQTKYALDYSNQLKSFEGIKVGVQYNNGLGGEHLIYNLPADSGLIDPTTGLLTDTKGLNDRVFDASPKTTTLYFSNTLRAPEDRATLDLGVRYAQQQFNLLDPANYADPVYGTPEANLDYDPSGYTYNKHYTTHYVDPRVGATFSPNKTLVFRTSFTVTSQFPDSEEIEMTPAALAGYPVTASSQSAQIAEALQQYVPFNPLKPSHTNSFDLGLEKGFGTTDGALAGSYKVSVDGFRRVSYDLIQREVPNYAAYPIFNDATDDTQNGRPYSYSSEGKAHSSGYDVSLQKRLVNKTDWNGFVTYMGLTSKATSSFEDTGYVPYYVSALAGTAGITDAQFRQLITQNEVPTTWDQQNTISVVANKRISRLFETTLLLDAGSGLPFLGTTGTSDAQHQGFAYGGSEFAQVPVVVGGNTLQPTNPVAGETGWHYNVSLNSNFHLSESSLLFLNVNNVFNHRTTILEATSAADGQPFYTAPSAAFPQGQIYYGSQVNLTPRFVYFGVRTKF